MKQKTDWVLKIFATIGVVLIILLLISVFMVTDCDVVDCITVRGNATTIESP